MTCITESKLSPWLAFAFLLLMAMTGCLLVQTFGHALNITLAPYSLLIALPPALWLTYSRCFTCTKRHVTVAVSMALALLILGIASRYLLDFTPDGMGYQQPSAEAIMNGWNPFGPDAALLWQDIYPSGAWGIEAAIAFVYGSVETTKMIQVWLIFMAMPVALCGLTHFKGSLSRTEIMLVVLMVLGTVTLNQALTHYVDAMIYLSGIAFIGGLLLYGQTKQGDAIALFIMAACIIFIVNAKLSGIYHAVMFCAAAVLFMWMKTKRVPWKIAMVLFAAGLMAVFAVGYRPYVTSFVKYGISLFPDNPESFSGQQRPSSFDAIPSFARFFYSVFSTDGGAPHQPAQFKWPWAIGPMEWKFSGDPDARTGGFGPLFALGFVLSLALFIYALAKKMPVDKSLAALGFACLAFSALFPQSWWLRYVPFGYAVPFLLLLAVGARDKVIRLGTIAVCLIFLVNSSMAASAAFRLFYDNQMHFLEVAQQLRAEPAGSAYLVPPVANYAKYNDAYIPLQRRFRKEGIELPLKVGARCPRMAEMMAEYSICY